MTVVRRLWLHVGFVAAAAVFLYLVAHLFDPPRLNWGDPMSDYNALTAGRNFDRYGFVELRFTPHLIDRSVLTDSGMVYTHYPQLSDVTNGVLRRLVGFRELWQFRAFALILSAISLVFVHRLLRVYWDPQVAQVSLALWVLNPLWIQHADYLHHYPYAACFGFGALFFLNRSFTTPRSIWVAGLFLALAYFASYDAWIFVPLLMAAMVWHRHGTLVSWQATKPLAIGAAFAIGAIAVKLATNAWALGGMAPMLDDLRFQFAERATDEVVKTAFASGLVPTALGRIERFFTLLLPMMALFWLIFPVVRRRMPEPWQVRNPIVLLLAALPFLVVFRELWMAYYYPALMLIPFWAVSVGILVVAATRTERRLARVVAVVGFVALAGNALEETIRFERAFFPEDAIRSLQAELPKYASPGQRVFTDQFVDSPYRYYLDRDVVPLLIHEPYRVPQILQYYLNPNRLRYGNRDGGLFVHHKNLPRELFDKGYYHVLGPDRLWEAWGNPPRYRRFIDSLIVDRDQRMLAGIQAMGVKLVETEYYSLWRIPLGPATLRR